MAPMVEMSPSRWFGSSIRAANDDRMAAAIDDLAAIDPEGYAQVCDALATFDAGERLRSVRVPVLAVAGSDDVATPPAVLAGISADVPFGRYEVLDGVGHLAPFEDPIATVALLRAHLDNPQGDPSR